MTPTRVRGTHAQARPTGRGGRGLAIVAAVAGGLTLLIRLALHTRSFDLYGDEVIYTDIGRSVISGGLPRFGGGPVFIHGPAFFYLEAGWARIVGSPHNVVGWIYEMRMLNAVLAAATAVVIVLLATRAASLRFGAVAGLLFALDPYCIRQNDRVLLETAMMFWVILGYLVFTSLIGRLPPRRDWVRAVGAGLLFGCAVLTKDEGALLTVLPLLAAAALGWGPRRALTLLTVATTTGVYAAYVALYAASRQFHGLWDAKITGIQRMLGLIQTSGFHSSGGGNLHARLIGEAGYFGTTYLLLVLAVPATIVLVFRGGHLQRMLGLLYCASGVVLAYAVVQGTLEDQTLYLLIVPTLLIIPVAVSRLTGARGERSAAGTRREMPRQAAIIAALVLILGINLTTSMQWWRKPDDGWARLISYMAIHVPTGTPITPMAAFPTGLGVVTPAERYQQHVRYVIVEWTEINQGYSNLTPTQVRNLVSHGQILFSFQERTYGELTLYKLPMPARSTRARLSIRKASHS